MAITLKHDDCILYNELTHMVETPDGTRVSAELTDNANCLADILMIASIREKQRAEIKAMRRPVSGSIAHQSVYRSPTLLSHTDSNSAPSGSWSSSRDARISSIS